MMKRPNADRQFIEIEKLLDGADLKMREYDEYFLPPVFYQEPLLTSLSV